MKAMRKTQNKIGKTQAKLTTNQPNPKIAAAITIIKKNIDKNIMVHSPSLMNILVI
jgi:hypothetical protein